MDLGADGGAAVADGLGGAADRVDIRNHFVDLVPVALGPGSAQPLRKVLELAAAVLELQLTVAAAEVQDAARGLEHERVLHQSQAILFPTPRTLVGSARNANRAGEGFLWDEGEERLWART